MDSCGFTIKFSFMLDPTNIRLDRWIHILLVPYLLIHTHSIVQEVWLWGFGIFPYQQHQNIDNKSTWLTFCSVGTLSDLSHCQVYCRHWSQDRRKAWQLWLVCCLAHYFLVNQVVVTQALIRLHECFKVAMAIGCCRSLPVDDIGDKGKEWVTRKKREVDRRIISCRMRITSFPPSYNEGHLATTKSNASNATMDALM